jgi:type III pantothenate kinase
MLLAIDVGNTHAVLGCYDGPKLVHTWRVSTHPLCTADEFRTSLHTLFALDGIRFADIKAVVLSSVVPPYTEMLRRAFPQGQLHVIDHTWPFSFTIAATPPNQVGMDRLVNAEAAVRDYGVPVIIVDSGTATTLCAVSADRKYLGGAIMPGLELSMRALAQNTAKLFTVELVAPEHAIGGNTVDALKSGIMFGYATMIDGMVNRFKKELGGPQAPQAKVIATGGVSTLLKDIAQEFTNLDEDLTLKGIYYLHEAFIQRRR